MNIGIIGLGLIGGSMAKAIKQNTSHRVYGYDIQEREIYAAILLEAIDSKLENEHIGLCDVIIMCIYPDAVIEFVKNNCESFRPGAVIIDCAGIKREICSELYPVARSGGFEFIGGHPMAGNQFSGFKSSAGNLFEDAAMILTPYDETSIKTREAARDLFLSIGFGHVHFTSPEEHDRKIAYTSQLAHIISNGYIKSPTSKNCADVAAGSFKDLTRVSKLNAPMWSELFMKNADFLSGELDLLIENLSKYNEAIKNKDKTLLNSLLNEGNLL